MVLDSSALMAILRAEPEERAFRTMIKRALVRHLSTPTLVEASVVTLGRAGDAGLAQLHALIEALNIETVALSADHARLAVDAYRRFGKGRHPAGLNFGDCFSYALAQALGEPLLFKGDDFSKTDITAAC